MEIASVLTFCGLNATASLYAAKLASGALYNILQASSKLNVHLASRRSSQLLRQHLVPPRKPFRAQGVEQVQAGKLSKRNSPVEPFDISRVTLELSTSRF